MSLIGTSCDDRPTFGYPFTSEPAADWLLATGLDPIANNRLIASARKRIFFITLLIKEQAHKCGNN
jgi:hypothetical protein